MEITVTDQPAQSRYEVRVDGVLAGFAQYRRRPDAVVLTHLEIDQAYGGRGIGTALAKAALDDIQSRGERVVPLCPFVARFIDRNPQYQSMVSGRQ